MVDSVFNMEKELKKLAVRLHIEYFGKGPEDVWVRTYKSVATFYCAKTITPLEETLLRITSGKEEVMRLRDKIYEYVKPQLFMEIEKVSGCKVLSFTADICVDTKVLHGSILFLENIDN